jgi:hypothetical protein
MSLSNINNGLVFAASPTLPEYPDNVAGTTYFQDAWATVDGWTGSSVSTSVSGGRLFANRTSTTGQIVIAKLVSFSGNKTYKIKIKCDRSDTLRFRAVIDSVSTILLDEIFTAGQEKLLNIQIPAGTSITDLIIASIGSSWTTTDYISIDWIYIGDGTYSSRLLDASGNGNHGTVFGATPTANGGISFDKINDYVRNPTMPVLNGDYSMACFLLASVNVTDAQSIIAMRTNLGDSGIFISSAGLRADARTSAGAQVLASLGGISANTLYHAVLVKSGTNISLYVNGVIVATTPGVNGIPISLTHIDIGASGLANYFGGTIRDPRIYNRALTAAEIEALATNSDAYNLDRVVRSITPVPGSVMTRDINGDTQVRRLESTIATGTAPLTVASTTLVTNLNADRVDGLKGSDFVRGTGTVSQTITGVKTFSAIPILPASDPTTVNQATRKAYIDGKVPGKITISASAPTGGTDGDIWITV